MSISLQFDVDMHQYHTMALQSYAKVYVSVQSEADIIEAIQYADRHDMPLCVIGSGSNILFANSFPGLVLQLSIRGIDVLEETPSHVMVEVAAGENWDGFLQYCLQQHWYGLENLAIIPGTVGAAPIQNIGAYGQEVANCIESVNVIDIATRQKNNLSASACHFAYRNSIFKQELAGKCIITSIVLRLSRTFQPCLSYKALADVLQHEDNLSAEKIRTAVINIRQSKLPDPALVANSGSYFKNPVISRAQADKLKAQFPGMPIYTQEDGTVKVAAGWLIEQSGWKGKRLGKVGVYPQQALVLVNYDHASYDDLQVLEENIRTEVAKHFAIRLEREPVLIN